MKKPDSLRQHILSAVSDLSRDPDRLLIHTDRGNIRCTAANGLSFEYSYDLNLILTEYAGDLDTVMIPLFDWVRVNQSELLVNLDKNKEAFKYETVILNNGSVDLLLTMPLTERVLVKKNDDGTLNVTFPLEPQYENVIEPQKFKLLGQSGEVLAEWQST